MKPLVATGDLGREPVYQELRRSTDPSNTRPAPSDRKRLSEFADCGSVNPEKITSFEQYRRSIQDVEVITFDELCERARFIVEDR